MSDGCCCSEIVLTPQESLDINVEVNEAVCLGVDVGETSEAIKRHNLDENSHPYILQNYASKEYVKSLTKTFVYEQSVASDTWIIEHNLDKNPSVSVIDSSGNEVIASVQYINKNTVIVTMRGAFKGKAYLN